MRNLAIALVVTSLGFASVSQAQPIRQTSSDWRDAFRQMEDEDWPTPNDARRATGAPGPGYWQQQVDYVIDARLDENSHVITGSATVAYTNNAPDTLDFLWFHLDQNRFRPDSIAVMTETIGGGERATSRLGRISTDGIAARAFNRRRLVRENGYGQNITAVTGADGEALDFTIIDTLMRVDLETPLETGDNVTFTIDWNHRLLETLWAGGRGGVECFDDYEHSGGDCIFQVAQWYPRAAAFTDFEGWHNKAFLSRGEFTLEFGDYEVSLTVPQDFIVAATGEIANADEVLTDAQLARLDEARTADEPVFIVTPEEAQANERRGTRSERTWRFTAENVRDFAWAGSRKFIWDAVGVEQDGEGMAPDLVLAMSFYPFESEPLWSNFSTRAVEHTIDVYNEFAFPYPYPTAQSVAGPQGGMEYPMITFNGGTFGRPRIDDDGNITYSRGARDGLIGVIIHEIGHIYFPMVVNSDERQWTWMDEGLNSFLEDIAKLRWEEDFGGRNRSDVQWITGYMTSRNQQPIMTQSDSVRSIGANAYSKPSVALFILRETIMGHELFDEAFRTYSRRWRFKRPTPYDFFRTMEEVSGMDLDWFWRGWFYSTDHVDISIDNVTEGTFNTQDPEIENARERALDEERGESRTQAHNIAEGIRFYSDDNPEVVDFYSTRDRHTVTNRERETYERFRDGLEDYEREILDSGDRIYYIELSNQGGLVMPVILEFTFANGETELVRIPAEVWRYNPANITWSYITDRQVVSVELDPLYETADADRTDNHYPPRIEPTRLELYRSGQGSSSNMMSDLDRRVTRDSIEARDE
ncbi:MAG: M1 family metallopeptidase [Maricaulis sp.]|uniref:M1 family metallopeptidase n=3 Tax=Maricaulis sp. TaxID=1486257 RepID=UPI001B1EED79|nr:M1 family metallopeptidase [Maricaulis sp.]MBO6846529.1 M1 family metallopeptidase [Maricaulis sp.]